MQDETHFDSLMKRVCDLHGTAFFPERALGKCFAAGNGRRSFWSISHHISDVTLQVANAYLEHLMNQGKFKEAADLCPQLLQVISRGRCSNAPTKGRSAFGQERPYKSAWFQDDAISWERYVYLFAQLRQLAVLAPKIPTSDPQLRGSAYEMVLHAFLLSPADHPQLLRLLETWPSHLYSIQSLTQAVVQRYDIGKSTACTVHFFLPLSVSETEFAVDAQTRATESSHDFQKAVVTGREFAQCETLRLRIRSAGGDSEALLESAARLYQLQGRYDLTLAILLRLERERVFEFIASHHLMPLLKGNAVTQLLDIDASRAVRLLVDFHEEVSAQTVAPAIQVWNSLSLKQRNVLWVCRQAGT